MASYSSVRSEQAKARRANDPFAALIAKAEEELKSREARELAERSDEIRAQCETLPGFVQAAWHVLEPSSTFAPGWHIDAICDHLTAVTTGDITRLLINVPPGMMKSLLTGVFFGAWEWGPVGRAGLRILGSSYSEAYAIRDNGRMRNLIRSDWYQALWPTRLIKEGERKFENDRAGWREGVPFSRLTGGRGDRLIIDDPHSTETAESPAERARTTRIFLESAPSRLNDPKLSAIIVIMQRLHQSDVSGVILQKELGYEHLMLPMEFESDRRCRTSIGFVDPRQQEGELLFPSRFPREVVERDKVPMGPYAVAGQYQQRPVSREGGLFKKDMIQIVDAVPAQITKRTRGWDFAATKATAGSDPDWTAGVRMARCADGFFWIEDVVRFREGPEVVRAAVANTASRDTAATRVRIPQDPGQAGKAQAADFVRALAGYMVTALPPSGAKEVRATPFANQVNVGNVRMLRGPWNDAFLEEIGMFPAGSHDDQIDAAADAFNDLAAVNGGEGVLEFYRQEAERLSNGRRPADQQAGYQPVKLRGNGMTAYGLSTKRYEPDADGFYYVDPDDAPPLCRAGFVRVSEDI